MTQNSAPVINPSDLAAIIAKSQGRGFAASGPNRTSAIATEAGFRPANFGSDALRIVPDQIADMVSSETEAGETSSLPEAPAPPAHPPARDFDAELADAFARGKAQGHAEGLALGRTEAQSVLEKTATDDLATARALFMRAAEALAPPEAVMTHDLSINIEKAVLRLASDRAGQAIDQNPTPFMARIDRIADRVSQGLRAVRVALHPDDLILIENHLLGFLPAGSVLTADTALMRGDVVIKAPSVTLSDLLGEAQP